jgi:hypothetical protein
MLQLFESKDTHYESLANLYQRPLETLFVVRIHALQPSFENSL